LAWRAEIKATAEKQMAKLDRQAQVNILSYLRERVLAADNPRQVGKALHGDKRGLWRYRTGDYRLICDIRDEDKVVVVLAIGHRKQVYR